jgi:hypothetical protein
MVNTGLLRGQLWCQIPRVIGYSNADGDVVSYVISYPVSSLTYLPHSNLSVG